ncbi:hypothetical protein GCM10008949_24050 [Deinococcus humi]|nr:DDE-type integrase/transposase/recombinase [Deinococcus humi]GGO29910.1 hypothetical protein GCM10008949_24050 [Deinococcus humi]
MWRAVDEYGVVLDVFLQEHRETEAARAFFHRLLGQGRRAGGHPHRSGVPVPPFANFPCFHPVEHVQVVSTAPYNTIVEHSHRPTRRQARQQRGFRSRKRAQGFVEVHARVTNLYHPARSTVPALWRRHHQRAAFKTGQETVWQAA